MNRLISGIKPTGIPTLGNYIGALKQFVKLANELPDYEILIFYRRFTRHYNPTRSCAFKKTN